MGSITFAILVICLVAVTGLMIGGIRVRGIGLGPAGVLFAGILFGHFGATIDHDIAVFAKEFGLVLFVFTIGLQLGPGIVRLWKKEGLLLNGMALAIVLQGFALVVLFSGFNLEPMSAAGIFSGATTNTPSLGAAEQAATLIIDESGTDTIQMLTSAYAVTYPGGIVGIITAMLLIRRLFRIDIVEETRRFRSREEEDYEPLQRSSIIVDNTHLDRIRFGELPGVEETGVRISRIRREGEETVHGATEETVLRQGDVIQVVGPASGLERFTPLVGTVCDADLMSAVGDVEFRRVSVTEPRAINKSLAQLSLDHVYSATVTRILRSGIEMPPKGASRLHYGDVVHIVGDRHSLDRVTEFLGNSAKSLRETRFSPLFVGIAVGVFLGWIPFYLPGVPFPVRLGLAGGPLVAAIALSLIGNVGNIVWYIPYSANLALRELGIILFLACAGLGAGETFFATALSLDGIRWMLMGLIVTMVPLLTTGLFARIYWKQNYLTICGVIAGSMTDPPALAFANSQTDSEASSTAYAAVYPLTMILRIIAAQALVFLFCR